MTQPIRVCVCVICGCTDQCCLPRHTCQGLPRSPTGQTPHWGTLPPPPCGVYRGHGCPHRSLLPLPTATQTTKECLLLTYSLSVLIHLQCINLVDAKKGFTLKYTCLYTCA